MKKKIYLIRHARPAFPGGIHLCLGRNRDIGICEEGIRKASALCGWLGKELVKAGTVYTSPLKRARETAEILSDGQVPVICENGLIEMDAGEWDGLDFDTIRSRYPELYERRCFDMSIPPPGGDTFDEASERMQETLGRLAEESGKEVLIAVSHSGIIRAFLCDLTGIAYKDNRTIPQEYASVNIVLYDTETKIFECLEAGYEGYVHETAEFA